MAKRLPLPVRRVLREPFDEAAIDAASQRVRLAPRERARLRVTAPLVIVTTLGALVVVVGFLATRPIATPLRLESGSPLRVLSSTRAPRVQSLDDGSRLELGAGASIEPLVNDSRDLVLLLRGTTTFDVQPGGPRRWTIECGLASVVVVGTRFTIEQRVDRLRVSVARGAVLVRGERVPDRVRRLGPGEELVIVAPSIAQASTVAASTRQLVESGTPSLGEATPETALVENIAPQSRHSGDDARRTVTTQWRSLAAGGAWDRAYAELGAEGIVREAPRAGVDELLALADIARLSGHPRDAVAPLERIVNEHPTDANAALAAFTLGRMEADQLQQLDRAARAFEQALTLHLPSALRPDALARLARAYRAAAHGEDAARAAARYLAEFPNGPQSTAMRTIIEANP